MRNMRVFKSKEWNWNQDEKRGWKEGKKRINFSAHNGSNSIKGTEKRGKKRETNYSCWWCWYSLFTRRLETIVGSVKKGLQSCTQFHSLPWSSKFFFSAATASMKINWLHLHHSNFIDSAFISVHLITSLSIL